MTNQLQTFNFKSHAVRAEIIENEPHFCLADVCAVFNMNRRSTAGFNLDPKGCNNIAIPTNGGLQEITFISEPNLYRIIFKSRKAEAVEFQNWVFDEVLPQIRKTGKYERSTTTVDDRTGLRDAVNMIVSKKGLLYSDAYSLIHQYMNVQHIDEIPKEQLPAAVAYCHKIVLEGELILNAPEETERKLNLNSEGVNAIINCYYTATRMQEAVQFLLNQLNTFRSSSLDSVRFNCEVMERYIREAHPHVEGLVKQRYRSKTPLMPQIGY